MYSKIKPILAALFGSKKFLALIAGVLVWLAGKGGLAITETDVNPLLLLIATWIGAQGLADIGKEKVKEEVKAVEAAKVADPKPSA